MTSVARKIVEMTGIDVDILLELLIKSASAEFITYYYYTILRCNLIGLGGEVIKNVAETARIEDRNHFEALIPRIYELGGNLPDDLIEFHNMSICPAPLLPKNPMDLREMLKVFIKAERCAIYNYNSICNMTAGKDFATYDLVQSILQEEIQHEAWFSELLAESPAGHIERKCNQNSPFVSKFLK